MKNYVQMTKSEIKAQVDRLSRWLAFGRYKKHNPGSSDEEASRYAHRHCRRYVDAAIDIVIAGGTAPENN